MSEQRPTFSESWYRVSDLRPRLRSTLQTHRQQFRGSTWHVVQDPASNRFFRLDEAGYHFLGLLDGRRPVRDAWRICNEQHGDAAPTQSEAINLLGELYAANLIQSDLPADAAAMFETQRRRVRREVGGFFMNLLFARVPVFDPDVMLTRWERVLGPILFRPLGVAVWLALLIAGGWALVARSEALVDGATNVIAPGNLFLLYACFALIKGLHELGHGLASKYVGRTTGRGGAVHTFGITLLVFTPLPFVDASSAWAFRSKWHRALVGAAGMYVELGVAAVAALVWANTSPGLLHALAYNLVFVAGVSTLVFNANPLFRFDGYYIMSDLLEIPNLAGRARDHLIYLVKRYVFGLRQVASQVIAEGEQAWLPIYGVAAGVYRIVVSAGIVLFVADKFLMLGAILAAVAVGSWLIAPLARAVRYLVTSPELTRARPRAILTTLAFLALATGGVFGIPVPQRARAQGVVEPIDLAIVHAEADGFIEYVQPTGTVVFPDDAPIVRARNDELVLELARVTSRLEIARLERSQAWSRETALAQSLDDRIAALEEQARTARGRIEALGQHAPIAGRWFAPDADRKHGAFVARGEQIGVVANLDRLRVRAVADQRVGPRLEDEIEPGARVRIRVRGRPDDEFLGRLEAVLPAGFEELPSAALGDAAGGSIAVAPEDERGLQATEPFFEIRLAIPADASRTMGLCSGQRVVVRFDLPACTIATLVWRSARQLVQRRFEI